MSDSELVTFRVVQPRQATYHYVWDPQQLRLRVDKLVHPEHQLPADYGTVLSAVWGHALMPGLLFGSGPVAPDALVQGRVMGALRATASGDVLLLVANTVDAEWASSDGASDQVWQQAQTAAAVLLPSEQTDRIGTAGMRDYIRQLEGLLRDLAAAWGGFCESQSDRQEEAAFLDAVERVADEWTRINPENQP